MPFWTPPPPAVSPDDRRDGLLRLADHLDEAGRSESARRMRRTAYDPPTAAELEAEGRATYALVEIFGDDLLRDGP